MTASCPGQLIVASDLIVIVHFLNCFSRFRYSYMYIMLFITLFVYLVMPSHIQTFGLLLILSRFIGLPRYLYQPLYYIEMFFSE